MIKIRTSSADIAKQVSERLPTWKTRAHERMVQDIEAGHHVSRSREIWSEIKSFFSDAQLKKCAYCESTLGEKKPRGEKGTLGATGVRWQVDHYRPEDRVDVWRPSSEESRSKEFSDFADQPAPALGGYYWLAYDISNYVGSCESCNNYKHCYFPVRTERQLTISDSAVLTSEEPLLINPIDAADDNPEELIEFYGPIPWPVQQTGPARQRALATIEILRLALRDDLLIERSQQIFGAWFAYEHREDPGKDGVLAREFLAKVAEGSEPHCNCIRSFLRLCASNPDEAYEFALSAAMRR